MKGAPLLAGKRVVDWCVHGRSGWAAQEGFGGLVDSVRRKKKWEEGWSKYAMRASGMGLEIARTVLLC
jgi:hypothetical protein